MDDNFSRNAGSVPFGSSRGDHANMFTGRNSLGNSGRDLDRLVVGVDFGTTFSGVAAVYSATPDDIDIIKSWPGSNGEGTAHATVCR